MNQQGQHQAKGKIRITAFSGSLIGPVAAILYEIGCIDIFTEQYLLNLWVVVALAILGACTGIYAIFRGVPGFGVMNLIFNISVAALHGFIAVFFGLGWSR